MGDCQDIRILVVDDHDLVRSGLGVLLRAQPDMLMVGEAATGEEALAACETLAPDLILMDVKLSDTDGIRLTREVRARFPEVKVLILSSYDEADFVRGTLQAGASGYLLKNVHSDQLTSAIRDAYRGSPTLSREVAQLLISQASQEKPAQGVLLSERELDVLELLVAGRTNLQIAEMLNIANSTVKFHVSSILSKLSAASRTEAVALALQRGLVHPR